MYVTNIVLYIRHSCNILLRITSAGNIDFSELLSSMNDEIAKAKELALSRKDILDKVEKWRHASEEENWLDEYERVIVFVDRLLVLHAKSFHYVGSSVLFKRFSS